MSFNYYPDLDRYFKILYFRNQEWFRYRNDLSQKEQKRLFRAFLSMSEALRVIRDVFGRREENGAVQQTEDGEWKAW